METVSNHSVIQFVSEVGAAGLIAWLAVTAGLRRSGVGSSWVPGVLGLTMTVWLGGIIALAVGGAFAFRADQPIPLVVFTVAIPVAIGASMLAASPVRRVADAIPQQWLAGAHVMRAVVGFAFLGLYDAGIAPRAFALVAGYGDIMAGAAAGLAALLVAHDHRWSTQALIAWNAIGLADFAVVLPLGIATIPDSGLDGFWPFAIVPGFGVPVLILAHVYSIRGLSQSARAEALLTEAIRTTP